MTAPKRGTTISRYRVAITWSTSDRNFDRVHIYYRVNDGKLVKIAERAKAKATVLWNPPNTTVRPGRSVDILVVSRDRARNAGRSWRANLIVRR